jgi:hypothetical protein
MTKQIVVYWSKRVQGSTPHTTVGNIMFHEILTGIARKTSTVAKKLQEVQF